MAVDMAPDARVVDTRHPQYLELKSRVHQELLDRLNLERLGAMEREQAEPELREMINAMLEQESYSTPLSLYERENLVSDVLSELFGLGPIEVLLRDPSISDILVNGANQIYIEREGRLEEVNLAFKDDSHLLRIIERIVSSVGRRIDSILSQPLPDDGVDYEEIVNQIEKLLILKASEQSGWNQSRTARLLQMKRDKLRYRMKNFRIDEEEVHST